MVDVFQHLIDNARQRTDSRRIGLIGYSGGGALATLIAERRGDVAWLITIAANLDLAAWIRSRGIAPEGPCYSRNDSAGTGAPPAAWPAALCHAAFPKQRIKPPRAPIWAAMVA
jgi:pimeloyl-ACP methyl ester carboxylesterase